MPELNRDFPDTDKPTNAVSPQDVAATSPTGGPDQSPPAKYRDEFIHTPEMLQAFIAEAASTPILAVDTEFIRERSFFPQLCLLQLATPSRAVIIDPLAIDDLTPLSELFLSPDIIKVFHAAEQDLELIFYTLALIPSPLFDIQLAAELLGLPQQSSLRTLVHEFAGVRLAKAITFSDWNTRPLATSQIAYALDDVRYLPGIYTRMHDRLQELQRLEWLEEDFATLTNVERYRINPELAWKKIRHSSSLNVRQLGVLKELAKTRDLIAIQKNLPRKWIISDELLLEIARLSPRNTEELFHLRGAESQLGQQYSSEVLAAIKTGLELAPSQQPQHKQLVIRTVINAAAQDLLRALVNQRARDNQVTPSMLINKDELVRLAAGERKNLRILSGWRYKLVGSELLQLLEGNLTMRLTGGRIEVVPQTSQTAKA